MLLANTNIAFALPVQSVNLLQPSPASRPELLLDLCVAYNFRHLAPLAPSSSVERVSSLLVRKWTQVNLSLAKLDPAVLDW